MSSGGWERVGGSKAKSGKAGNNNNNKMSKTEKKNFAQRAPKLEDVCKIAQSLVIK